MIRFAHVLPTRTFRRALILSWVALLFGLVAPAAAFAEPPASFDEASAYVYVPPGALERVEPLQVVFALHGVGDEGKRFCQGFLNAAERNGWVVVAPTFKYRNWMDPATVAEDDVALTAELDEMLDSMATRLGHPVRRRAMLLGFSRGAQLAHRFALVYPERTRAVAAVSAGTYTYPGKAFEGGAPALAFPYGTADLEARTGHAIDAKLLGGVPFWIAVGGADVNAQDVPRQWDSLFGETRLQRATRFASTLVGAGIPASLTVFPGIGHGMTPEMLKGAASFMEEVTEPLVPEPTAGRPAAI
jgi:poly(3-hydroxybutyrate) depolymerase